MVQERSSKMSGSVLKSGLRSTRPCRPQASVPPLLIPVTHSSIYTLFYRHLITVTDTCETLFYGLEAYRLCCIARVENVTATSCALIEPEPVVVNVVLARLCRHIQGLDTIQAACAFHVLADTTPLTATKYMLIGSRHSISAAVQNEPIELCRMLSVLFGRDMYVSNKLICYRAP